MIDFHPDLVSACRRGPPPSANADTSPTREALSGVVPMCTALLFRSRRDGRRRRPCVFVDGTSSSSVDKRLRHSPESLPCRGGGPSYDGGGGPVSSARGQLGKANSIAEHCKGPLTAGSTSSPNLFPRAAGDPLRRLTPTPPRRGRLSPECSRCGRHSRICLPCRGGEPRQWRRGSCKQLARIAGESRCLC